MKNVLENVFSLEYCCNCGVCTAVCPKNCLEMQLGENGEYRPQLRLGKECVSCSLCLQVCPWSGIVSENEETLGLELFPTGNTEYSEALGRWDKTFVGATSSDPVREQAPSGGLASSTLCRLLEMGEIDAAIVAESLPERPWFRPFIARTSEEIRRSSGSVYHVMTLGPVLNEILQGPVRKYAIMALPCAVKSLRLAQKRIPALRERLKYIFTLTCGGCNSLHVADLLCVMLHSREHGLKYRSKVGARHSQDFRVTTRENADERQVRLRGLFGFLWINHVGQLNSCAMCDDLFGTLADVTFMDAWLPDYFPELRGTNLVVSRNPKISHILETAFQNGQFCGGVISAERVVESQQKVLAERHHTSAIRWSYEKKSRTSETLLPCKRDLITLRPFTKNDEKEARARIRFHRQTRRYLAKFSRKYSNPARLYPRIYVYRVFWKTLCSLTLNGLLGKTIRSLKFDKNQNQEENS